MDVEMEMEMELSLCKLQSSRGSGEGCVRKGVVSYMDSHIMRTQYHQLLNGKPAGQVLITMLVFHPLLQNE